VRRACYWLAVLLGAGLLATGLVVAVQGYAHTAGPDGAVRGYFAALRAGDAPEALAFGDVPAGPHTLLTSTVLAEQQRIAPLSDLRIGAVHQHGATAVVHVSYTLGFAHHAVTQQAAIGTHRRGGSWRLDRVAVATQLLAQGAAQRMTILGAGIPAGRTLLFPGALPITFDTPYLQLDPSSAYVGFDASAVTAVLPQPTRAGRNAMLAAVRTALRSCVASHADVTCPLPDERYVPGSVRGSLATDVRHAGVGVDSQDRAGTLIFSGDAVVDGSYQELDFQNRAITHTGYVQLEINAAAYAVPPLHLYWTGP
jgi:hypothetical protein